MTGRFMPFSDLSATTTEIRAEVGAGWARLLDADILSGTPSEPR